eukprot:GHVT01067218.1.p1 GENE.GHVT01067218.1~~GHVT01067218.1.p1  ORF type:complete len:426 (-),score=33.03 GHVT01067218.1:360-1637(-)
MVESSMSDDPSLDRRREALQKQVQCVARGLDNILGELQTMVGDIGDLIGQIDVVTSRIDHHCQTKWPNHAQHNNNSISDDAAAAPTPAAAATPEKDVCTPQTLTPQTPCGTDPKQDWYWDQSTNPEMVPADSPRAWADEEWSFSFDENNTDSQLGAGDYNTSSSSCCSQKQQKQQQQQKHCGINNNNDDESEDSDDATADDVDSSGIHDDDGSSLTSVETCNHDTTITAYQQNPRPRSLQLDVSRYKILRSYETLTGIKDGGDDDDKISINLSTISTRHGGRNCSHFENGLSLQKDSLDLPRCSCDDVNHNPKEYCGIYEKQLEMELEQTSDLERSDNFTEDEGINTSPVDLQDSCSSLTNYQALYNRNINTWKEYTFDILSGKWNGDTSDGELSLTTSYPPDSSFTTTNTGSTTDVNSSDEWEV